VLATANTSFVQRQDVAL